MKGEIDTAKEVTVEKFVIEEERVGFKKLIIENPNYFGTFPEVKIEPIKPMKVNTKYEELRCIGFYQERDLLEAIVDVKLPYGYKGTLCSSGSFEFVRFFVDWDGDGDFTDPDEDVGIVSINVHDIPDREEPCLDKFKPLSYAATITVNPRKLRCTIPNLVKVRAILSWDWPPSAGNPNFLPPWGNVVDRWIQIKPSAIFLKDIVEVAKLEKLKLKPSMLDLDASISKTEILTPADLKEMYCEKGVPEHRFNLPEVQQIAEQVKHDPNLMATYKLDLANFGKMIESVSAVLAGTPDTKYEELRCVGLDYDSDRLVATLTVKLPYGYGGGLCANGSYEYVAFWAYVWDQIEQMCHWKYFGTTSVNAHDIPSIPHEGLQYAVQLPVDLSAFRDKCSKPRVIRIRAVLSWQTPPSKNDPYQNPVWGNGVEALIHVRPGTPVDGKQIPFISVVGGMAVNKISGNSETTIPSAIGDGYANGVNALESPFGGVISICGHISNAPDISGGAPKLKYKVQYKKTTDTTWQDIVDKFTIYVSTWNGTTWSQTHKDQIPVNGYFEYEEDLVPPVQRLIDASDYGGGSVLIDWHTPVSDGDGLYEVRALLYQVGAPPAPGVPVDHVASNVVEVMIDNTAPDCAISLDSGPCEKFTPGGIITGTFSATDQHIWMYRISVAPYAPPPGQLTHVPVEETYPALHAPGVANGTFALDTENMQPCGYVIYLYVWDRAILNNHMTGNQCSASVGFCLLKQE